MASSRRCAFLLQGLTQLVDVATEMALQYGDALHRPAVLQAASRSSMARFPFSTLNLRNRQFDPLDPVSATDSTSSCKREALAIGESRANTISLAVSSLVPSTRRGSRHRPETPHQKRLSNRITSGCSRWRVPIGIHLLGITEHHRLQFGLLSPLPSFWPG